MTGPSSAALGAAKVLREETSERATSAQASAITRPVRTWSIMTIAFCLECLRLLDFDRAGDDLQLRGHPLERLPGLRLALLVGPDRLIDQRTVWIVLRDKPDRRPEMIGSRIVAARMRAVDRLQLLAIGQFHEQALEPAAVERLAILIVDAEAEHDFFQMLELIVQHAEGSRRALLSAAYHVAFKRQLPADLRLRAVGKAENGNGEDDCRGCECSH